MFSKCCFEAGDSPTITIINQSLPSYGATANPEAASFSSPKARRANLPHQPLSYSPNLSDQNDDDEHEDVFVIPRKVYNPLSSSSGASSEVKTDFIFSPKFKPKSKPFANHDTKHVNSLQKTYDLENTDLESTSSHKLVAPHVTDYVKKAPLRRNHDRSNTRSAQPVVRTGLFFTSPYTPTEHSVNPLLHSDPLRPHYTYATSHYEDFLPDHDLDYYVPANSKKDGKGSLNLFNEKTQRPQQRACENKQNTVYQFIKMNTKGNLLQQDLHNQENRPRGF